jgi:hypothetical protein
MSFSWYFEPERDKLFAAREQHRRYQLGPINQFGMTSLLISPVNMPGVGSPTCTIRLEGRGVARALLLGAGSRI